MNSTEQKIREAFEKEFINTLDLTLEKDAWGRDQYQHPYIKCLFDGYKSGYLALLNELAPQGEWNTFPNGLDGECRRTTIYTLPEGVNRDK